MKFLLRQFLSVDSLLGAMPLRVRTETGSTPLERGCLGGKCCEYVMGWEMSTRLVAVRIVSKANV